MEGLDRLESAVLEKLLAGDHPVLAALRAQSERGRLASREYTGAGFFCNFAIPADAPRVVSHPRFVFGDVHAGLEGLKHGAGFVIFVTGGHMDFLEGFSYDEPWPKVLGKFILSGGASPGDPSLPDDAIIEPGR